MSWGWNSIWDHWGFSLIHVSRFGLFVFLPFCLSLSCFFTVLVLLFLFFLELLAFSGIIFLFLVFSLRFVLISWFCVSVLDFYKILHILIDFGHVLCTVPWCIFFYFFSYLQDVLSLPVARKFNMDSQNDGLEMFGGIYLQLNMTIRGIQVQVRGRKFSGSLSYNYYSVVFFFSLRCFSSVFCFFMSFRFFILVANNIWMAFC